MDYCIKNYKNIYIKLDGNGSPITCIEKAKGVFEYSKAKNICEHLPKHLKKMDFTVQAIPDPINVKQEKIVIKKDGYVQSNQITLWLKDLNTCNEIITTARKRQKELNVALSNTDKELSNELHKIELEKSKNACAGYMEYKKVKQILEKRRIIKDELLLVTHILRMDFRSFNMERIQKIVDGLEKRKYRMKIVDDIDVFDEDILQDI